MLTSCSPCYSRTSLIWTQQDLEELDNRMGNSEANEDGGMEEEQDESQEQGDSEGH